MIRWLFTSQLARVRKVLRSGAGYTITETLIVLAVTSAMFVAIAVTFSGRQARSEFNQSVRNYEGRLETIISEVVNGYYASGSNECTASLPGVPDVTGGFPISSGGSSEDCIFVGKVVASEGVDNKATRVTTLVGRRTVSPTDSTDVDTFARAFPTPSPNVDVVFQHSYQLQLEKIVNLETNTRVYGVGFINKFSKGVTSGASGSSGVIDLYAASASPWTVGSLAVVNRGVVFCLLGNNGQRAEITIGANNNSTSLFSTLNTSGAGACSA